MSFGASVFMIFIIFVWLALLTLLFSKFYLYYTRTFQTNKKESVLSLLDNLITSSQDFKKDIDVIYKRLNTQDHDGATHVQKIGLLRFNPFNDTGGDQSFILALLDKHQTGVVISSLHTRSGTRWYAKKIEKGKGLEHSLSDDEQKAVKLAHS